MNLRAGLPTPHRLSSAQLELILAVTRRLAAPFDLPALLAEVTTAACSVLDAERASVWLLDAAAAELVLEIASDARHVRIPVGHGLAGACARDGQVINVPDCATDPRFDGSVDRRTGFVTRCSLTLPLPDHRGVLAGVMQVLNKRGGVFTAADQTLAEALAAQCAMALSRATMTAQLIAAERLARDLDLARLVQTSALPTAMPQLPGYAMHAVCLPAAQTGGDTYDLALQAGGMLSVVLADAAGHGIGPALSVMQMQAMQRMALRTGCTLETVFALVNDQLADILPDGHFVTAFIGLLDARQHRLRFLSGGQSPILHYVAAADAFIVHKATSFPMGAMRLARQRPAVQADIAAGDIWVLLSDGVYEYEAADGRQFGRERVQQVVRQARAATPAALCDALLLALREFAAGAAQEDDITVLLIKRDER